MILCHDPGLIWSLNWKLESCKQGIDKESYNWLSICRHSDQKTQMPVSMQSQVRDNQGINLALHDILPKLRWIIKILEACLAWRYQFTPVCYPSDRSKSHQWAYHALERQAIHLLLADSVCWCSIWIKATGPSAKLQVILGFLYHRLKLQQVQRMPGLLRLVRDLAKISSFHWFAHCHPLQT